MKKLSKLFSRRFFAFVVCTVALFTGELTGWQYIIWTLVYVGALTFEKARLSAHFGTTAPISTVAEPVEALITTRSISTECDNEQKD